jgi:adenosylcobinamide-phosphate synthase
MTMLSDLILPAAFALDALIGDPYWLPHPIRGMGRAIEICEPAFRRWFRNETWAGALFALFLILSCWGLSASLVQAAYALHPLLGVAFEAILIFFCLSARSLSQAAMEIGGLLKEGSVDAARSKVALIVGRDVQTYGRDDIARATVETVAENFVDGVLAPLFFAALGGAPLAMAYKMVNTLDSMVGYKNDRYLHFGRAAARIDDAANFLPARLSVPLIALAAQMLSGRHGRRSLVTGFAQGRRHSSPNAGFPEAAFAGALAVKLNGPNTYGGVLVDKPYIGIEFGPVSPSHIRMACRLMTLSSLLGCIAAWCLRMLVH